MKVKTMLQDKREIHGLHLDNCEIWVGAQGVTAIKAYGENGMHCDIPWFAIYREGSDEVHTRINAASVDGIIYHKKDGEQ
jgi:hypothetical protein